jgi:hypothetical protein
MNIIVKILAALAAILYIPLLIVRCLIPIIICILYLCAACLSVVALIVIFVSIINYMKDTYVDPPISELMIVFFIVFMFFLRFFIGDIDNFMMFIEKWGKDYYDRLL